MCSNNSKLAKEGSFKNNESAKRIKRKKREADMEGAATHHYI